MSFVFAAWIACARVAGAGAPGNPGSGTSGPPVPLGAGQLHAIAAKGIPAATQAPVPATHIVDGKTVPVVSVTSGAMKAAARSASAPRREAAALHPAVKLPTISPAIGRIPRPEWSHPYELAKRPDVAVIGSQRVTIAPGGGNAAPASNATPATEHRP